VVFLLALALVLALPLVWDSRCFEVFRAPKRELAFAIWTTLGAIFLAFGARSAAWRDPWWWAWAGVLAGAVASAPASGRPGLVILNVVPIAVAALGWGGLRLLSEPRRERLFAALVASGVLQAGLTTVLLMPAFQPEVFSRISEFRGRFRWIGTLGNPADVAVYLTLPALLAVGAALSRRRQRWAFAAAATVMLAVIVGTLTLSAIIAVTAGGALLLLGSVPRRVRIAAVAALLVVAAAGAVVGPLANRVRFAISEARHGGLMWVGSGRGAGYAAALGMLAAHPITGVGLGLFENNSFRFLSEEILAHRARVLRLKTAFGEAHNDPLQHAAETGALGVLLAVAGLFLALRRPHLAPGPLPSRLPLLVAAAVLLLLQFPLHLATIAAQWLVLWSLAVPRLPASPVRVSGARLVRWAAVAAVALAASWVARQRLVGSIAWQQASTLTQAIHEGRFGAGAPEAARRALAALEARLVWYPGAWEALVVSGNVAMLAERPDRALAHFRAALDLAERPETRFNVGMALLALGDQEAGYTHLIKAVKLNPRVFTEITNAAVAEALRRRLDAEGYGRRNAWIYSLPRT